MVVKYAVPVVLSGKSLKVILDDFQDVLCGVLPVFNEREEAIEFAKQWAPEDPERMIFEMGRMEEEEV